MLQKLSGTKKSIQDSICFLMKEKTVIAFSLSASIADTVCAPPLFQ